MHTPNKPQNNILGIILIVIGAIITFVALGSLIFRAAIAAIGLYLIFHGLELRGQHQHLLFTFHRFKNKF